MKGFKYTLGLCFIFLLNSYSVKAKHIIGGEIYYECLGPSDGDPSVLRYQVYMKIYRDCLGSGDLFDSAPGATTTASVSIYQGSTFLRTQYLEAPTVNSVNPNPGNACVLVPPEVCVEEGLYVFIEIDLPIVSDPYHLVYQRCCRNEALTNINDPGTSGATYTVDITPEAQQAQNSSPVFTAFPPFIICAGEDFAFDHSATDADGHRMEYTFCSPFLGGGANNQTPGAEDGIAPDPDAAPPFQEVSFITPTYSANTPLGVASNFQIDLNTGRITGVPMQTGQFVVTVCVSEFDDNNVLLSEVRRDFQFLVTVCERPITINMVSDEISPDGVFILNACSAGNIFIENQSQGQENVTDFRWSFDVNGMTETYTEWSPTVGFPAAGTYVGQFLVSTSTGCMDSAQVSVNVLSGLSSGFSFNDPGCTDQPITFINESSVGSNPVYNWQFGVGNSSSELSPTHQYTSPGSREVSLAITDDSGCADTTRLMVDFFPLATSANVTATPADVCLPELVTLSLDIGQLSPDYTINWNLDDGRSSDDFSPMFSYQPGSYTPSVRIDAPNGCFLVGQASTPIMVRQAPVAGFSYSPDPPTTLEPTLMFSNISNGGDTFLWDFDGLGTSQEVDPTFTFPGEGTYRVELTVGSSNGCTDTLSQLITVIPVVAYYVPNAFSPNNDGQNDVFRGFGPGGGLQDFEFAVFSRWGDQVFFSQDPDIGWDGTHQTTGEPLPQGSYVYYMTFLGPEGESIQKKGLVNLIR